VNKKKEIDIYGNYMGYMDFNGVRLFDTREVSQFYYPIRPAIKVLESDSRLREDSVVLRSGDNAKA
jgi:hypothetical protein